jgi:hypothetical protein
MKKLLVVLGFVLFVGGGSAWAQAASADIVVVRTVEVPGNHSMVVTRGEDKSEFIAFTGGVSEKNTVAASEAYYRIVKQLYQEGYLLQGVLKAGDAVSTMLFVRAPKP